MGGNARAHQRVPGAARRLRGGARGGGERGGARLAADLDEVGVLRQPPPVEDVASGGRHSLVVERNERPGRSHGKRPHVVCGVVGDNLEKTSAQEAIWVPFRANQMFHGGEGGAPAEKVRLPNVGVPQSEIPLWCTRKQQATYCEDLCARSARRAAPLCPRRTRVLHRSGTLCLFAMSAL